MALTRAQAPALELPQEAVHVAELGGEVIVRGFGMPALLRFFAARREAIARLAHLGDEQAQEVAAGELVPLALHLAVVVLDDGLPLYSEVQWQVFGGMHPTAAMALFARVMALSGTEHAAEKKT